jgi:DNA mismatch endonuclease (patch repair protein)
MKPKVYLLEKDRIKVPRFEERAGFYTTKQRSKTMSKIRGKNSVPEMLLRRALWAKNVRFRIHRNDLPGRPDLVIEKYKLVVFVDGDFWHGFEWATKKPKSNQSFWIPKIERNMQRDQFANESLRDLGYNVMRFWEHQIRLNLAACVNQVMLYIETASSLEIPFNEPM